MKTEAEVGVPCLQAKERSRRLAMTRTEETPRTGHLAETPEGTVLLAFGHLAPEL